MLFHHITALGGGTRQNTRTASDLLKYPWITDRAPTDHHTVHAGNLNHSLRVLKPQNSAVSDKRNPEHLFHFTQLLPVGIAAVEIPGHPGMHRHHIRTALLHNPGDLQMSGGISIETDSRLDRNRKRHGFPDLFDHFSHEGKILQQGRPGPARHNLLNRTAAVKINPVKQSGLFYIFCRLSHGLRISSENMPGNRVLPPGRLQHLKGFLGIPADPLGTGQFGIDRSRPLLEAERAHGGIRVSGHRGEYKRIENFNRSECYGFQLHEQRNISKQRPDVNS